MRNGDEIEIRCGDDRFSLIAVKRSRSRHGQPATRWELSVQRRCHEIVDQTVLGFVETRESAVHFLLCCRSVIERASREMNTIDGVDVKAILESFVTESEIPIVRPQSRTDVNRRPL